MASPSRSKRKLSLLQLEGKVYCRIPLTTAYTYIPQTPEQNFSPTAGNSKLAKPTLLITPSYIRARARPFDPGNYPHLLTGKTTGGYPSAISIALVADDFPLRKAPLAYYATIGLRVCRSLSLARGSAAVCIVYAYAQADALWTTGAQATGACRYARA